MISEQRVRRALAAAVLAGSALFLSASAQADVKLPAVLADHMVLQQGMAVPIWGTADAGEEVTVTFGTQKQTTKADDKGHWEVKLGALNVNDKPETLTVAGKNKVELKDILVGEVWICSGQSNMEFGIGNATNAKKEIAEANYPLIRLFSVPKSVNVEPKSNIDVKPPYGLWLECTPANVSAGGWNGFTAVGYFFGRDLHNDLKVPVGLIHTSWGGTPAEAWTPKSYMESDADLKPLVERLEKSKKPDQNTATTLYNGMIAPIVPFAVKGSIWYQGESNAGRAYQYRKLLPAMIKSWRDAWHEPSMDFYIVSLANFKAPVKDPGDSDWAELREAQAMTAAQPHNGEALAIDLADANKPDDIHPHNKQDVGHRLELVALARTYGKKVDYSGPEYKESKIDGDKVTLHFNFADGMAAKGGGELKGFQIAGEDKKWHWAGAKVEGDSIVVSSKDVEKPAAVRYDWATNPNGNLYNKAELPAVPFRTDTWAGVTEGKN